MILKNHSGVSKRKVNTKIMKGVGLFALVSILVISLYNVVSTSQNNGINLVDADFTLLADAETTKEGYFVLNEHKIGRINQQSSDFSFDGKYSIKLNAPKNLYGFSYIINDVKPGDQVVAQVWVYSSTTKLGCICLKSLDKNTTFYAQSTQPVATKNGWQLLQVIGKVVNPVEGNQLKMYCYNNSPEPIYFDNLALFKTNKPLSTWKPKNINVVIKDGEFAKLKKKREEALKQGMLLTTNDSWVKGMLQPDNENDEKINVSLRLKGDWLDHLHGDKWSFRVKTQTDKSWNRLKTFSLQNPKTRAYLKEWLLHKLFIQEDILTTRYEFTNMKLNNKDLGLYVYEEHFLKQIPEYNLKREGPIVKFTENGLWEARLQAQKLGLNIFTGEDKANPDIRPFGEGKTLNTPNLSNQFKIAQNLLYEYQFGLKKAKDIFELDLLAKYYAIMDITGGHHGVIWHNQRYYYNPVIGKLEPIGFDGFDETGNSWVKSPFIGYNFSVENNVAKDWHAKLFMDHDFLKKYMFYLNKFSKKDYITKFISSTHKETSDRLAYIQSVIPSYKFSPNFLYERALKIQVALLPNSSSIHTRTLEPGLIAVYNRHKTGIEIVGSATADKGRVSMLDSVHFFYTTAHYQLPNYSKQVKVPTEAKFLVYRVVGLDKLYYVEINPWPVPRAYTPMQELESNLVENHPAYYYNKNEKKVVFKDSAIINTPIIIPENHIVKIDPGTSIDIVQKAFVLSYSAVQFMGNEEQPILVNSSDATANGFTVLQAKEKSNVNYTTFSNMNTLAYKGWNLTGAVTFYESDVVIRESTFTKNSCEDALNIIRSDFLFENSTISHTFADGFDADFCTGFVNGCYFYKTGNDGIDFSTSTTTIMNTKIVESGDKGISIGEQGTATIIETYIDGAVIGVASKDLSKVTVKSIHLENCEQGFAAYQKKPEYGGGKIIVEAYTDKNLKYLHKIFPGSYLKLIDEEIKTD